ncbi:MAG TPA: TetR/AcrR family transcriptional regulator [Solirubrobacterales bacterium]|nr:TetR/AcrR family transcriptional regulator [Solirubrobacterales bacterium]
MSPSGKAGTEAKPAPKVSVASARPALPREFIALHKRRRIMDALADLTAEQGYEATKISDIVRRAAVARKTLYDNFSGKEEVFLAAFDTAVEEMARRIEESCAEAEGGWQGRVEAGLAAFLGYVAEEPTLARMCLIEALSATPETTKRYEDALQSFVEMARRALPKDDRLPETIEETLVGGVVWIVYQQVRRHETEQAEDLLPELSEFMMAPYLGVGVAEGVDK